MAVVIGFSLRQLSALIPKTCCNISQRAYADFKAPRRRSILKKLGYPDKPKRPPTVYLAYIMANRGAISEQHPDMSFREISEVLKRKWKDVSESEKQKMRDEYQVKFKQYKEELEKYKSSLTSRQREEMNQLVRGYFVCQKEKSFVNDIKKLEREMNKPKAPPSPFYMFFSKNMDSFDGKSMSDKFKQSGEAWKSLPEAEREKYRLIFRRENAEYKEKLEKWEEKMLQEGHVDLIRMRKFRQKLSRLLK